MKSGLSTDLHPMECGVHFRKHWRYQCKSSAWSSLFAGICSFFERLLSTQFSSTGNCACESHQVVLSHLWWSHSCGFCTVHTVFQATGCLTTAHFCCCRCRMSACAAFQLEWTQGGIIEKLFSLMKFCCNFFANGEMKLFVPGCSELGNCNWNFLEAVDSGGREWGE